jgi:hypothetical protein
MVTERDKQELRKRSYEAYMTSPFKLKKYPIETPHDTWEGDFRFWEQLDPHIRTSIYQYHELYEDGEWVGVEIPGSFRRSVEEFAIRRGQWAQPDLVEADMHWSHYEGSDYERYALKDKPWDEMTESEKQRFMAL